MVTTSASLVWYHRIKPVAGGAGLDPSSASRSGRALITLVVRRRESRARSQANKPGRGWTLQFSGLETLEKARQRIQYRPACRLGEGAKRSNQAIRGQVLTLESHKPNGRSGSGASHLLVSVLGVRDTSLEGLPSKARPALPVVRGSPAAGQGNFTRSWQQFPRGRSGERNLDPRGAGPGEQGSRPRVSVAVETLEKPDNTASIRPRDQPAQGFWAVPPTSFADGSQESDWNHTGIRREYRTFRKWRRRPLGTRRQGPAFSFRNHRPALHQPLQGNDIQLTRLLSSFAGTAAVVNVGHPASETIPALDLGGVDPWNSGPARNGSPSPS